MLSGEDDVNVPRKGVTDWSGRLRARFMLLSNEVPRLADASAALSGRFVTLVLTRTFYNKEDPHLTDKLLSELPGILNWALDGWERLQRQGRFTVLASSKEVMKELEHLSSPIQKFIEEECFLLQKGVSPSMSYMSLGPSGAAGKAGPTQELKPRLGVTSALHSQR